MRNKETFSDVAFTIQAHKYNWLPIFGVCFFSHIAFRIPFHSLTLSLSRFKFHLSCTHNGCCFTVYSWLIRQPNTQHTFNWHIHNNRHRQSTRNRFYSKVQSYKCVRWNMETRRYVYTYISFRRRIQKLVTNSCQMMYRCSLYCFNVPKDAWGVSNYIFFQMISRKFNEWFWTNKYFLNFSFYC